MSSQVPGIWGALDRSRPTGNYLVARQGIPELTSRLLFAVDSQAQRHLLIVLLADDDEFHDAQSRGLIVVTRELVVRGQPSTRYLDFECRDPAGYPILDLIAQELAFGLSQVGACPAEVTRRVLAKWRRFWGQVPRAILSREDQLGLFGELWFLRIWLAPHVGLANAVNRWRGPLGARHDFEWIGRSVEVKTTTSTRGRLHWINGIDQLEPPEIGELLFFSLRLREEAGAGNSLPVLITAIRQNLKLDPEATGQFETLLLQAGYSSVRDEEYAKTRVRIVEERLFVVSGDFPRIIPASFPDAVSPGIEKVEYEINLNSYDHLCIGYNPMEVASQLQ